MMPRDSTRVASRADPLDRDQRPTTARSRSSPPRLRRSSINQRTRDQAASIPPPTLPTGRRSPVSQPPLATPLPIVSHPCARDPTSECPTLQPTPGPHIVRERGRRQIEGTNGCTGPSCCQRDVDGNVDSNPLLLGAPWVGTERPTRLEKPLRKDTLRMERGSPSDPHELGAVRPPRDRRCDPDETRAPGSMTTAGSPEVGRSSGFGN
jgi:hypothetical protein